MVNKVTGAQILTSACAADLLPHLYVDDAAALSDRLVLSTEGMSYVVVPSSTGASYSVEDCAGEIVFGTLGVSLGTAMQAAVAALYADLTAGADNYSLELHALELASIGAGARVRGDTLVISHMCSEHAAVAQRDAARPWLWEVASGDMASDACPVPQLMKWADLRMAVHECSI